MNTIDFCYWLQGHFELNPDAELSKEQVQVVRDHLNLVFKHEIDPLRDKESTIPPQILNSIHNGNDPQIRC